MTLEARSGNLDRPQKNWSPWSAADHGRRGGRVTAPSARFLQWKATLNAAASGASPDLDSVDAAYLLKNIAPRVTEIEITPANYKYAPPVISLNPSALPRISFSAAHRPQESPRSPSSDSDSGGSSMSYAKGWLGARWNASDENGDDLEFKVEIRGAKETEWKLLKDNLRDRHFSFDSTAFADGEYRLRITASDAPSNTPQDALSGDMESEVFIIDNTPPVISALAASRARRHPRSLARRRRAQHHQEGRVFARWRRLDESGSGRPPLRFQSRRLRCDHPVPAGQRTHHRRPSH